MTARLVWLSLCRQPEPHRPHAWGFRRFCRGGWSEVSCRRGCRPCKWVGDPCLMCNGTGVDRDPRAPGGHCRCCWGHGRDAA